MVLLIDEPAVVRRPDGVVRVTGSERLAYLHVQLSQHLEQARPGGVADFLYLDPKGNALAAGRAVVHADAVLLVVPRAVVEGFVAALERFKFLMDVAAEDCSGGWSLASVRGPARLDVPGAPPEPMSAAACGEGLVIRDRSGGVDLLGPRAWVDERVAGLGLPEADPGDWDAWRIANAVPAWGSEVVPGRRPQELGLLPTHVHLRKGCYPGQESIAKTYNLGRPRRALALVAFDGPVAAGESVHAGGHDGELTSVAQVGDRWLALALLPVDRRSGDLLAPVAVAAAGLEGRVVARVGEGLPIPGAG